MATVITASLSRPARPASAAQPAAAPALGALACACLFYMLAFPKAGFRLYEIPLTFGYMLSGVMFGLALLRLSAVSVPVDRLLVLAGCAVMAAWSALFVRANGSDSVGFLISYFVSITYLPLFGMMVFSGLLMRDDERRIEATIVWAIRLAVVFGLILFVFKYTTGQWIEIPYLTVNIDDVGTLDEKHINRGGVFKLISTYNNGNVFGVAMCILGPLYLRLEPRKLLRAAFYLALLLTLSRTVWLGFLAIMLLRTLSERFQFKTLLSLVAGATAGVALIAAMLVLLGTDLGFVTDTDLGGRVAQITNLSDAALLPTDTVRALPEIMYTGVLLNYGYIGLLLFVAMLLATPALLRAQGVPLLSTSRASACLQGLLLYAAMGLSDAAFNNIPVMMIFWMIAGLGLWYVRYQRTA